MDLPSALQRLSAYRARSTRASQDIFDKGLVVLNSKSASKLGDDSWEFLEQLALAAIDVGRIDIADQCLQQLIDKFPGSPRVDCLEGIRIEATESPEMALKFYEELLDADPVNAAFWKRKISVLRRMGKIERAVEALVEYLDTFYTDVEAWAELADIYSSCNQYTSAMQSLSHVLLLSPQNPFYVLLFAETAYTSGDVPLALKMFLNTIDMADTDEDSLPPTGMLIRAWYGVKLCTRRLLKDTRLSSKSASHTPVPGSLSLIDSLAKERLDAAYQDAQDGPCAKLVPSWLVQV
ncbi:hypothetical protein JAAARDRAFT_149119 [Jaapia argillacea MUCL 33604]|uniref:ER membrane protein complex subunit 2 n=1 Tax=Jaapia argillacea MUCL 33604 TaxID=933084 RepID=A0A067Q835_9AGAM|nr:hypothetical protein JAAARDRAFT_149119 [Jaapia argillacea MUCL 33604]